MTRRLRRTVCVLSLALWVVTGWLAVRCKTFSDVAEWRRVGRVYGAASRYGCLTAYTTTYPPGEVTAAAGFRWYETEATAEGERFHFGPGAQDPAYAEAGIRRSEARIPYWFLMLCTASLPTWRLGIHVLRRRRMLRSRHGGFVVVSGVPMCLNPAPAPAIAIASHSLRPVLRSARRSISNRPQGGSG